MALGQGEENIKNASPTRPETMNVTRHINVMETKDSNVSTRHTIRFLERKNNPVDKPLAFISRERMKKTPLSTIWDLKGKVTMDEIKHPKELETVLKTSNPIKEIIRKI